MPRLLVLLFLSVTIARGFQSPPAGERFAVSAIHIVRTLSAAAQGNAQDTFTVQSTIRGFRPAPEGFVASGVSLSDCVLWAYSIRGYELANSRALGVTRYDISAKADRAVSVAESRILFQRLLADRFQLRVHREKRDMRVYALSGFASALRLKPAEFHTGAMEMGVGHYKAEAITMADFAQTLSRVARAPIVDQTGLIGMFAVDLTWEDENAGDPQQKFAPAGASVGILSDSLRRQLGLTLKPITAGVDSLVVDSVNPAPDEN